MSIEFGPRTVCHVVSDLSANQNYTFQVSAFNHGVTERSLWSGVLVSGPSTSEVILGLEKGIFIVAIEKDPAGLDPDSLWEASSHMKK